MFSAHQLPGIIRRTLKHLTWISSDWNESVASAKFVSAEALNVAVLFVFSGGWPTPTHC